MSSVIGAGEEQGPLKGACVDGLDRGAQSSGREAFWVC